MPQDVAERSYIFQRALLSDTPVIEPRPRTRDIIFPSTLNARKGTMLALEAFASVPEPYRLVFANSGPDEERLKRRTIELGLEKRVLFLGRIPRDEYFALAKSASMAIFAGVNEDGGCALCETMLLGVPVVVLAHSGPKEIVEQWSKDPERVVAVKPGGGVMATVRGLGAAMRELIARNPERTDPYLDRERAIEQLKRIYRYTMVVHARKQEVHAEH